MKRICLFITIKAAVFILALASGLLAVKVYERACLTALIGRISPDSGRVPSVDIRSRVRDEFVIGMSRRGEVSGFGNMTFSGQDFPGANFVNMRFEADFRDAVKFLDGLRLSEDIARIDRIEIESGGKSAKHQIVTVIFALKSGA